MRLGTTRWLLVGLLCLAVWPTTASTQETAWKKAVAAAVKALQEGRLGEAEKLLLAAVQEAEKFGEQDPRWAGSLLGLAAVYKEQGKYAQVEPLLQRALAIGEKALGPGHPAVATRLNNLAALYDEQGKYTEAEPLYRRTLAIVEKALGPEHPQVATVLENYAALLHKLNRDAEAEKMEARAKGIRAKHAQEIPQR